MSRAKGELIRVRVNYPDGTIRPYTFRADTESMPSVGSAVTYLSSLIDLQAQNYKLFWKGYEVPEKESLNILRKEDIYDLYALQENEKTGNVMKSDKPVIERLPIQRKKIHKAQKPTKKEKPHSAKKLKPKPPTTNQTVGRAKKFEKPKKKLSRPKFVIASSSSSEESDLTEVLQSRKPKAYTPRPYIPQPPPPVQSVQDFVAGQISYYFSDKNYYTDPYIQKRVSQDEGGWMDTEDFLTFPKIKKAVDDRNKLLYYLEIYDRPSKNYELSEDSTKIRKKIVSNI